jgi:hypothetical protein
MQIADATWNEINKTTIKHCWQKASILLDMDYSAINPTEPISSLPNADSTALLEEDPIARVESVVEKTMDLLTHKIETESVEIVKM